MTEYQPFPETMPGVWVVDEAERSKRSRRHQYRWEPIVALLREGKTVRVENVQREAITRSLDRLGLYNVHLRSRPGNHFIIWLDDESPARPALARWHG